MKIKCFPGLAVLFLSLAIGCDLFAALVRVGTVAPRTQTIGVWGYYSHVTYQSISITGDTTQFSMVNNSCVGTITTSCTVDMNFHPTEIGRKRIDITLTLIGCFSPTNCNPPEEQYITFTGEGYEPTPICPRRQVGSDINVDGQSVIERIPIVGSNFSLSYSSARSANYVLGTTGIGQVAVFNPHGWTISPHHYYDVGQAKTYFGDGRIEQLGAINIGNGTYQIVDSGGQEVYVFGSDGRHLETKYGLTGTTKYTFSYSGSDHLTKIEDAFGNETLFSRDGSDNLTSITAPRGQVTTITRDGNNLISEVENPNSETYEITYKTSTTLLETFKKPGLQTSTMTYDGNGLLTKDQGAAGDFWALMKSSNVITESSKIGRTTTATVSDGSTGYSRVEVLPTGGTTSYSQNYLSAGVETTGSGFQTTNYQTSDERFGAFYQRPYQTVTTTNGISSTITYGKSVVNSMGTLATFFNFDTITETQTRSSRTHTSLYDAATKTNVFTSHEGATVTTQIDAYERPVETKIGNDTAWTYSYDGYGRRDGLTQGSKNTLTYTYNGDGFVSQITNVRSENIQFAYDLAGRVTQITLPDSRVIGYAYDANGNMTGVTPPSRPQHVFDFNLMELLGEYQPPSIGMGVTKNTTYTYNDDRQLSTATRPDGKSITYNYGGTTGLLTSIVATGGTFNFGYVTASDRLAGAGGPDNIRAGYGYTAGLLTTEGQTRTSDNFLFGRVTYSYDGDHRLVGRSITGNATAAVSTINYTLDGDDKITQAGSLALVYSYPSGRLYTTTIGNISDTRTYDAYGNLETYAAVYTTTGTTLYSYTLTRDNGSRISSKSETILGVTSTYDYTYDSAGRLTLVKKNSVVTDSFNYDSNSNRTSGTINSSSFTATYDDQDRILTYGSRVYSHNENGDLTQIQWNVTDTSNFVYDALGNLRQVTIPTGDVHKYLIDGISRRSVKQINGNFQYRFLWEGRHVAAALNGTSAINKEFVYATSDNVPDYMIFSGNNYRFIRDHLGTPRLVVRTDNGTVTQRMDYTTLGAVTSDTNAGFQPFGFAGGLYDGGTQLLRFGARDYDPRSTGRWTSKDPIRFAGGSTNLYGYVANDPINFVDPSGLKLDFAQQLGSSLAQIWSTPAGNALMIQLMGSSQAYNLTVNSSGNHYQQGNTVAVDPGNHPFIYTANGIEAATTTRILAHEMGHLTGTLDDGINSMNNVNMYENPIMQALGGSRRISYTIPGGGMCGH